MSKPILPGQHHPWLNDDDDESGASNPRPPMEGSFFEKRLG